jgi:imidazolonepropionase-like amidohydrolase
MRKLLLAAVLLAACACKAPEDDHVKVIIGAVLIDGLGGPPLTNSIVAISGNRIRAAGPASAIPIPADAGKIDGSARFLMPSLVEIAPNIQDRDEAALTKAREARQPAVGRISTLADAEWMVEHGASALVGSVRDTETLDPDFLAKLRDLRITVAPALTAAGPNPEIARSNALRLFQAGVPVALAAGVDPLKEMEALADAGIPPLDVIVAGTRNGAAALHDEERGAVQPGKLADLILLSAHPGEDIRNLRRVVLRIVNGEIQPAR